MPAWLKHQQARQITCPRPSCGPVALVCCLQVSLPNAAVLAVSAAAAPLWELGLQAGPTALSRPAMRRLWFDTKLAVVANRIRS